MPPPLSRTPLALTKRTNGAPLFDSEVKEIEEEAIAALRRAGELDVLTVEEVRALQAAAAEGRVVHDGPECLVKPTAADAFYATYPGGKSASLELVCTSTTCHPMVAIARSRTDLEASKELVGEPATPIDPASWRASIKAGTWAAPAPEAAIPGLPDTGQYGPLTVQSLTCFGGCAKPPQRNLFPAKLFKACANDDVRVLAEFDETGHPLRCEFDACACGAIAKVDLKKADGTRRLFVDLGAGPGGKPTFGPNRFGGGLIKPIRGLRGFVDFTLPAFPRVERSPEVRKELSGCLKSTRREASTVAVTLGVAANGAIENVTLGEGHGFSASEEACIAERLPKVVTFTCPGTNSTVKTTLEIRARKIEPKKK